jgi:protein TonB
MLFPRFLLPIIAGALAVASAADKRDHGPTLASKPALVYPEAARRAHATGAVRVKVRIGADGRVLEARAVSGPFLLLVPAEEAIRTWRYQPAVEDSQPVEATTYVTVDFKYTAE